MEEHITASPLCWPPGWKREKKQIRSRFGTWKKPVTIYAATTLILDQLRLMTPKVPSWNVIISTDLRLRNDGLPYSGQREPDEKGAAVWWRPNQDSEEMKVLALNKYDRIADNLYAIGKTLESLRSIERWGSGEIIERTFTGFVALPYITTPQPWRDVLGFEGNDIVGAEEAYRRARSKAHPDKGGSTELYQAVIDAWSQAINELKGKQHEK